MVSILATNQRDMRCQVYNAPERRGSEVKEKPADVYSFGM
jgi:hypothetical protein